MSNGQIAFARNDQVMFALNDNTIAITGTSQPKWQMAPMDSEECSYVGFSGAPMIIDTADQSWKKALFPSLYRLPAQFLKDPVEEARVSVQPMAEETFTFEPTSKRPVTLIIERTYAPEFRFIDD